MWNRYDYPTAKDADEGGDILILRNNGRKSIYNWEDFCDEKLLAKDIGWMPLPPSDNVEDEPKQISIAITAGDRTVTIKKVDNTIEIHDSEDPMGQPVGWQDVGVGIEGLLTTVEYVLIDEIMDKTEEESSGCCKNCKCKEERSGGRNFDSIYGAHWAW